MKLANLLTSVRILIIVPFCVSMLFWRGDTAGSAGNWLLPLLLIAIATDYFDGIVARARNEASSGGMLFDHTTDFFFVTSGLATAGWLGLSPKILPVLIVIAFAQYVLDSYYLHRQKSLKMSFLGRWNGIFYFLPLALIAGAAPAALTGWSQFLLGATHWVAQLLVISTLLSIADRALAPWRSNKPS